MWHQNIAALAANHKVYAIDLWGCGYSSREPLDYGYSLYSDQLLKFMDALNIQKASLIGQSMGGGTIIKFLTKYRERADRVIFVSAAGMPNPLPTLAKISNLAVVGEFMYALKGTFLRKLALRKNFLYNHEMITEEFFDNVTMFHQIKGTTNVLLSISRKEFFDKLKDEIITLGDKNIPILIVWGKQENSTAVSIGEKMHELLKGSQFKVLDEAGHCSNMDQPERFNQLALDFLA
jgi:pimeloyl-ACP methyl ester carboxylesterase